MTELEARTQLATFSDYQTDPALTEDELDEVLERHKVSETEWYVFAAVEEVWRRKAGRVAAHVDFSTPGMGFKASQKQQQFLGMAAYYRHQHVAYLARRREVRGGFVSVPVRGVY